MNPERPLGRGCGLGVAPGPDHDMCMPARAPYSSAGSLPTQRRVILFASHRCSVAQPHRLQRLSTLNCVCHHGGPESNDTLRFDFLARLISGMGYIVLQPQYRGSTGYGSNFLTAIYQHFGDRAYRDVDSATDFALAQGWADPNRLAIFGWSAGGFMTSWTVTQTNRYKAAIEGAGITDWLSFIPTSDTWQTDYDARLQEKDAAALQRFSAVMYAERVSTPLLILHGEADVRVPTFQGREFYVLLKERGKTVRMVTYPGSPHFPALAEQRRDVCKEIMDWLTKYNP
jgi:dipeptidyl aminopeptidase/acylaminoacyl peptidase